MLTEYNGYGRADTEDTFDRKLGIADRTNVLYDSKTKTGSTYTLGMGFIHSVESFTYTYRERGNEDKIKNSNKNEKTARFSTLILYFL